jgi:predicted nucleotidyltransferase
MSLIKFNLYQISNLIQEYCPTVMFAYLFGSSQNGTVQKKSDIDIAVYLSDKKSKEKVLLKITEIIEDIAGSTPADIVFLNDANPILAFEVLRSKQLFVRKSAIEEFAGFYSLTCREYESESFWMKKQLEYRNYEVQWNN